MERLYQKPSLILRELSVRSSVRGKLGHYHTLACREEGRGFFWFFLIRDQNPSRLAPRAAFPQVEKNTAKLRLLVLTSMGLTVMVSAESSQSISFSLPLSWSLMVRWCAARMRNTPRMIMKTRKLTHTTMTTVAALGTTAAEESSRALAFDWVALHTQAVLMMVGMLFFKAASI